ncbi:MAG: type II toxin-antitoxin system RelE/ParE family toxin [Muribaculaceae bacterium]|nr:type II toxin-antitoxin system RelE/ParE family toxin [Muribaculaceae bacterium]
MENQIFQLVVMEEAKDFLKSLPLPARKKIAYNIDRVKGGEKDNELFKKLENSDIWEFRTLFQGIAYRLFSFWDTETSTLVVATHGIIKKTQKTPSKEIAKAEELRKKYFEAKNSK